jgi:hypothetical protein
MGRFLSFVLAMLALFFAGSAQAQYATEKDLAAYRVAEKNVFRQVKLTPRVLDNLLAIVPDYSMVQYNFSKQMLSTSQSGETGWRKVVAQAVLLKKHEADILALVEKGGFRDFREFNEALGSVMLVVMPDEIQRHALQSVEIARHFKTDTGFFTPPTILAAMEQRISMAQQKPLSDNIAFIESRKSEIMNVLSRSNQSN